MKYAIYCDSSVKLNSCIALVIVNLKDNELNTKAFPIKGNKKTNQQLERMGIIEAIKFANNLEGKIIIYTDQLQLVRSYNDKKEDFYYNFVNSYINSNKIKLEYTSEINPYMKLADKLSKNNHFKDNLFSHFAKFINYIIKQRKYLFNTYNKNGIKACFKGIKTIWND